MAAPTVKWICSELSTLLGIDATEDIARYMLSIESSKELEEYICEVLDASVPENRQFINQLLRKWQPPNTNSSIPQNVQVYRKADLEDEPANSRKKQSKKNRRKENDSNSGSQQNATQPSQQEPNEISAALGKSKTKFVPLFCEDGEMKNVAKLPGRHTCECQAHKHPLVNNCLQCGRVVCQQEGSGPCVYCGTLVCTKEEQEVLARGSKKSERLRQSLMQQQGGGKGLLPNESERMSQGLASAMKHKDKLIHYDRTSVKRTKVIDDESDYFATDATSWRSQTEKDALRNREEELRNERHGSRRDRKVTLDFAGRRVIDADANVDVYSSEDAVVQAVHYGTKDSQYRQDNDGAHLTMADRGLVNPNIADLSLAPKFMANKGRSQTVAINDTSSSQGKKKSLRIQDAKLMEMSDEGMCMSMHQPWASLLVHGIKKHEGRSWYTPHRGRLWIAATSKQATVQDIEQLEQQYNLLYNDMDLPFPKEYPSGCLLGCVDVSDCLAQDQYQEKFPGGESSSPYVFICENPHELIVKFPMKGKHKIYHLDNNLHQGAKRGIRKVNPKH